jgi:hypothetical protein
VFFVAGDLGSGGDEFGEEVGVGFVADGEDLGDAAVGGEAEFDEVGGVGVGRSAQEAAVDVARDI